MKPKKCTFCAAEAVTTTAAGGHPVCADCAKVLGADNPETTDLFLRTLKPETLKTGTS